MPLASSPFPQSDQEWRDLAASTLTSLQADASLSTPASIHRAPAPGTPAFAKTIDHTLLKLDADEDGIYKICEEARRYNFKTVCVRSHFVSLAAKLLKGTEVGVCSVVCFPEGTQSTLEKIREGQVAVDAGATELDFVIDHPRLKQETYQAILDQLQRLRSAFSSVVVKIILETSQLSDLDIVAGCLLAAAVGFDLVKTSTGFLGAGATEHHVRLLSSVVDKEGKGMGVKASGGMRTAEVASGMLKAGATRLGLSGSVAIMEEGSSGAAAAASGSGGY